MSLNKPVSIRDRALDLLTHRPYGRQELIQKLLTHEADQVVLEETADWLEDLGLLNDVQYAQTVVRHYSAKGYGPYRIRDELHRRGVSRELCEEVLREIETNTEQIDAFVRQKLRGVVPDRTLLKRVSDGLARRGYRWEEIGAALRRYDEETADET